MAAVSKRRGTGARQPSGRDSLPGSLERRTVTGCRVGVGAVKVWDLTTRQAVELAPESGVQSFLAFSPDAHCLVFTDQSLDRRGTIGIWDTRTRRRLAPIVDPNYVGPMRFSPDGRWFAFGVALPDASKRALVWDFAARKQVREWVAQTSFVDAHKGYAFVFTPTVSRSSGRPNPMAGSCAGISWPEANRSIFNAHREGVTALAISPDGRTLATGAGYSETNIKLWEVSSFRPLGVLTNHQGWISDLRFSPDGQTLASSSADQTIRLGTWQRWRRKASCMATAMKCGASASRRTVGSCSAAPGTALYIAGRPSLRRPGPTLRRPRPTFQIWRCAPDATQFAGIRQGGVCLGDTRSGELPRSIAALGTNNTSLLFSRDGQHLFAGTQAGEIQVWSLSQEKIVQTLRGPAEPVRQLRQDALGRISVCGPTRLRLFTKAPVGSRSGTQPLGSRRRPGPIPVGPCLRAFTGRTACGHRPPPGRRARLGSGGRSANQPPGFRRQNLRPGLLPGRPVISPPPLRRLRQDLGGSTLRELTVIRAHSSPVYGLAFSPTAGGLPPRARGMKPSGSGTLTTWQSLITLERKGDTISQLAFTRRWK